jgi:CBS domain-containing protein
MAVQRVDLAGAVRSIMRPGVVTVPGSASLTQVAQAMTAHGVHAVLVVDAGAPGPAGWATGRALIARLLDATPFVPAIDAVTELPTPILPSAPIADAIRALAAPGVTHLLVTTGPNAVPQGVVSETDIIRFAASRG